ncbi:MAG TPA: hypothetical protein VLA43_13340 [Longimicrobiales bacterium]|nr:hypothetical protein [Longimicrobiales bacterium]
MNRRAVRVRLRNRRALRGQIHITEGQSLVNFLSVKTHFLNLTDVQWEDASEEIPLPHLSVRVDQIVWVEPLDAALHLSSATLPSDEPRSIEIQVDDRTRLHVKMNVARETRMTDYLDANPGFLPLYSVRMVGTGDLVERVALNHGAIEVICELEATDPRQRR